MCGLMVIIVNFVVGFVIRIFPGPFLVDFFWNIMSTIVINITISMNLSPRSFFSLSPKAHVADFDRFVCFPMPPPPQDFVTLIINFELYF